MTGVASGHMDAADLFFELYAEETVPFELLYNFLKLFDKLFSIFVQIVSLDQLTCAEETNANLVALWLLRRPISELASFFIDPRTK